MEYVVLGWFPDGPALRLDWRRFAYAGKFVMTNTGKAVVRDPEASTEPPDVATGTADEGGGTDSFDTDVLAAVSFNEDRTDGDALWLRYVTVREDKRGEGLGPRLCAFAVARADERGYERARIAVNNPFAYEALHRAGFAWTGRETGVAELVLERPCGAPAAVAERRYQDGLDRYRERDYDADGPEVAFLESREGRDPPSVVDVPGPTPSDTTDSGG